MPRRAFLLGLALCSPIVLATPANGQAVRSQHAGAEQPVRSVVVLGDILDGSSATPLAGATVILDPVRARAATPSGRPSSFPTAARTTTTNADGRYRFAEVVPGKYRLLVQRTGYRSTAVELTIEAVAESRISVLLTAAARGRIIARTPVVGSHRRLSHGPSDAAGRSVAFRPTAG